MIHRADYHRVLLDEAVRLGAEIRLNSKLVAIESSETPRVVLETGEVVHADVIVGADGMLLRDSLIRNSHLQVFGPPSGMLFLEDHLHRTQQVISSSGPLPPSSS